MDLTEFSENALVLTEIFAIKDDIGNYEKVYFIFDEVNFLIIDVDWNTDEVIILFEKIFNDKGFISILPNFYGITFIRSWLMVNHKGYQDAIQLEFWDKTNKEGKFLQIQAVASHLNIYELNLL